MGYLSTNAHGRVFNTCSQLCAPLCAGAAIAAGLMLSSFNVAAVKKEREAEGGCRVLGAVGCGRGIVCCWYYFYFNTQNAALNATN